MFNKTRFELARLRRGLTKRKLAELVGVTERSVLAYGSGTTEPEEHTLQRIADVLRFPAEFFFGDDVEELEPNVASFRAQSKLTAAQRDVALSAGAIALLLDSWIEAQFTLPEASVPDLRDTFGVGRSASNTHVPGLSALQNGGTPEACAEALRALWGLGEAPIKSMIALLESHGVRVFSLAIDAREVDAFSMWYGGKPYVFLNTKKTAERSRFDAAHELGHLVMHRHGSQQGREVEREADAFASAFLMPRKTVIATAPRFVTLDSLIKYKKNWIVSAAALNYRLHALGLTTDWIYRSLCVQLSQLGRNKEPESAPFETSQILTKVFSALRSKGITKYDVARDLKVTPEEIDELTFGLMINALPSKISSQSTSRSTASLQLVR